MTSTSSSSSSSSSVHGALKNIINMLQVDWAREHIFGETPATEAAILSSPLQQLHSLAFRSEQAHFPEVPIFGNDKMNFCSDAVHVPAFSHPDGYSVGFIVESSRGAYYPENPFVTNGGVVTRFVVNERDCSVIALEEDEGSGEFAIICFAEVGKRSINYTAFAIARVALLTLVTTKNRNVKDYLSVTDAVLNMRGIKGCGLCGARMNRACDCSENLRKPRSPLDLGAVRSFISRYIGEYQCSVQQDMLRNGTSVHSVFMRSDLHNMRIARHGCAERLIVKAVARALSTQPPNIARALIAPLAEIDETFPPNDDELDASIEHFFDDFFAPVRDDQIIGGITENENNSTLTQIVNEVTNTPGSVGSDQEEARKRALELREWKAYQRKLRNRESAARSNLARKRRRLEAARKKMAQNHDHANST